MKSGGYKKLGQLNYVNCPSRLVRLTLFVNIQRLKRKTHLVIPSIIELRVDGITIESYTDIIPSS